ncbi:MAG: endo-1,4-beta-xylanase [Bacillota bacterium]
MSDYPGKDNEEINEGEEWLVGGGPQNISQKSNTRILKEAEENIENYRKGEVEITFVDQNENLLTDFEINIKQTESEFTFGAPLYEPHKAYRENSFESTYFANYTRLFTDIFNMGTALCYWNERNDPWVEKYQGKQRIEPFVFSVDWAKAQGLKVKGHPLVWSVPKAVPDWLLKYDYETQMKFLEVRVRDIISAVKGKVDMWDLVNEALWEPSWRHIPEREWPHLESIEEILTYIEPAMKWVWDEDPGAKYTINEYGLVYDLGVEEVTAGRQRKRMIELLKALKARSLTPDRLGVQAHTGGAWYSPADVKAVLDELSVVNIPIQITEFWAHLSDYPERAEEDSSVLEEKKAQYVKDFYTVAFGHPNVTSISYWGFSDLLEHKGGSQLNPKPAYERLYDLIHNQWRTEKSIKTDGQGKISFNGFYGTYELQYRNKEGKICSLPFNLIKGRSNNEKITIFD